MVLRRLARKHQWACLALMRGVNAIDGSSSAIHACMGTGALREVHGVYVVPQLTTLGAHMPTTSASVLATSAAPTASAVAASALVPAAAVAAAAAAVLLTIARAIVLGLTLVRPLGAPFLGNRISITIFCRLVSPTLAVAPHVALVLRALVRSMLAGQFHEVVQGRDGTPGPVNLRA